MSESKRKSSRWGVGVWALYGAFVVFILSLAAWAGVQRFDLVEQDYYEKGLTYQDRIDRSQRALEDGEPQMSYDRDAGAVSLCVAARGTAISTGRIVFYRSSDARSDFVISMATDSLGCQTVADERLIPGPWRVKCEWVSYGEPRYWEGDFVVPSQRR